MSDLPPLTRNGSRTERDVSVLRAATQWHGLQLFFESDLHAQKITFFIYLNAAEPPKLLAYRNPSEARASPNFTPRLRTSTILSIPAYSR
jgi:hypothetical protein